MDELIDELIKCGTKVTAALKKRDLIGYETTILERNKLEERLGAFFNSEIVSAQYRDGSFDRKFRQACEQANIKVKGVFPNYYVEPFGISILPESFEARLQSKAINSVCPTALAEIMKELIGDVEANQAAPEKFLSRLFHEVSAEFRTKPVRLVELRSKLTGGKKGSTWQFDYDLFKLLRSDVRLIEGWELDVSQGRGGIVLYWPDGSLKNYEVLRFLRNADVEE